MGDAINVLLKKYDEIKTVLYIIYAHAHDNKNEPYLYETEKRLLNDIEKSAGALIDDICKLKVLNN